MSTYVVIALITACSRMRKNIEEKTNNSSLFFLSSILSTKYTRYLQLSELFLFFFLIHAMNEQTTSKSVTQIISRGRKFCKGIGKKCNRVNVNFDVLLLPLISLLSCAYYSVQNIVSA